jgi:acyl-CoA reductase-like NAD-dependent aldehyde dehydrogenase
MLKDSIWNEKEKIFRLLVGGEWIETKDVLDVSNPFSGKITSRVFLATKKELICAIETAHTAYPRMAMLTPLERGKILEKTADLLERHIDELVNLVTAESGKPVTESLSEVRSGILRIRFGAEEAKVISGEAIAGKIPATATKTGMILRQPLGVILGISPFNYPFFNPISKIVPALASGNAVILKPASDCPTVALLLCRAFEEAGLPKGVLQVIICSGQLTGDLLVPHPYINMISFTGSSSIGREVARKAVLAKLHLELGGKCPGIVLSDADLNLAAKECVRGAFKYSGQRCDAISRILVVRDVYKSFIKKIIVEAKKWKVGDPTDESVSIGPLINEKAVAKVEGLVSDAVRKGAEVFLGGKRGHGLFYEPTVLGSVTGEMRIAWEETFGPVATVLPVEDYEEAIYTANKSEYALDSSVFTKSLERALDCGMRLLSGTVQINAAPSHGIGDFPFGGDEASGLGRQGIFVSAEEMTKTHAIIFN